MSKKSNAFCVVCDQNRWFNTIAMDTETRKVTASCEVCGNEINWYNLPILKMSYIDEAGERIEVDYKDRF